MEFDELIRKRKMIREYEFNRPIPDLFAYKINKCEGRLTEQSTSIMLRAIWNQVKDYP